MPTIIEYDKTNGKIIRIFSAEHRPPDVAHLSYQTIPLDSPAIDLSMSISEAMEIIKSHIDGDAPVSPAPEENLKKKLDEKPPKFEEV